MGETTTTTVNGGDGRVRFLHDPVTGKTMFSQGENVTTFDMPNFRGGDGGSLLPAPAAKSPGELLLEELAPPSDFVFRRHVDLPTKANDIWIQRLDLSENVGVGIRAIRDRTGLCDFTKANHVRALKAAAFLLCCQTEDGRPYFGDPDTESAWNNAWKFATNKTDKGLLVVSKLFAACTELNPTIVNRFGAEDAPEVADDAPLAQTGS